MLSRTKSQSKVHPTSQSQAQHVGFQTKTKFNNSFSSEAALQRGNLREQRQVKEPELMKRSETSKITTGMGSTFVRVTFY